jgi:hypothetical protein
MYDCTSLSSIKCSQEIKEILKQFTYLSEKSIFGKIINYIIIS